MKKLNIFYYATIWSFIIGICCATYLNLINFIINFVWHVLFDKLPVPSQALPFFRDCKIVCVRMNDSLNLFL